MTDRVEEGGGGMQVTLGDSNRRNAFFFSPLSLLDALARLEPVGDWECASSHCLGGEAWGTNINLPVEKLPWL